MKFGYRFSNLFGTVYKGANLVFTSDGNCILSAVGNRISVFDLVKHSSKTLPFQNGRNIAVIALSPNDELLLTVDVEGKALLVNFRREVVLSHFNFKEPVTCLRFSPTGKYFAVGKAGRKTQIWQSPGKIKDFAPFRLLRTFGSHHDRVTCLDWSPDGRFLLSGSRDTSLKLQATSHKFLPVTFSAHRDPIVGCFFSKTGQIYSVSADGAVFVWEWLENAGGKPSRKLPFEEGDTQFSGVSGRWKLKHKHFCMQQTARVTAVTLQKETDLLTVTYDSGIFGLYSMPAFSLVHTLSITQHPLSAVAVNPSGEWLALASANLGQLVVWEWQSETYVLKQQGHYFDMNSVAYSSNGQLMVTGSDDGKVKVWNSRTGFCFVTFTDHVAPVSSVVFSPKGTGHAVLSASLDGTVRAYDLIRYRNFRTFATPEPTQFCSLAIDPSGEVVCAGSMDGFEIYLWSMQTGKLLDALQAHEGPVSCLAFNPLRPILASGSWDCTVRVWDVFANKTVNDIYRHESEVLAMSYRPDGKELCVATLDGNLTFWNVDEGKQTGTIEGRRDISGGRLVGQAQTAKNAEASKHFTSVCYSADGQCVLAGGSSRFICIYHVGQKLLVKKYQMTHNLSLDGILDYLHTKNLTEGGPMELIEDREPGRGDYMPGARRGDMSSRKTPPAARCKALQFSPTGRSFGVASTEGLLVYSIDDAIAFDPFELDIDVTPDNIEKVLAAGQFLKALIMSFQLNETELVEKVFYAIPYSQIQLVAAEVPINFLYRVLVFLANCMIDSPHIEYHLSWMLHLCSFHGHHIKADAHKFMSVLRDLQKNLAAEYGDISSVCNDNKFSLQYLLSLADVPEEDEAEASLQELLAMDRSSLNPFAARPVT